MNKFDLLWIFSDVFSPEETWKKLIEWTNELLEEPIIEDAEEYIIIENDMEVYYGK